MGLPIYRVLGRKVQERKRRVCVVAEAAGQSASGLNGGRRDEGVRQ